MADKTDGAGGAGTSGGAGRSGGGHDADARGPEHDDHRLSRALRTTIVRAVSEAQRRGAPLVEAEHLLLSLSLETGSPVASALSASGLDHDGIERMLRAERERSLESAGVVPIADERLVAAPRVARPRWGASARDVLVRAHRAAAHTRRTRTAEVDLLSGILGLELGTVPRALDLAGVDRHAILVAADAS